MADNESGFTLLETLIAVVIATTALIILAATASSSLSLVDHGSRLDQAVTRAHSHLIAAAHGLLVSGAQTGDDGGGYRWRTVVTLAATAVLPRPAGAAVAGAPSPNVALFTITTTVIWREAGRAKSVSLASQALGPGPAETP